MEVTIEQVNKMLEEDRKHIELADALGRLFENPDFKKVFLEDYLEREAIRQVGLLGDSTIGINKDKHILREDIQERMIGIARFKSHIRWIFMQGDTARNRTEQLLQAQSEPETDDTVITNT